MDILTTILVGAGGAIIALLFEHTYLHFRERKKDEYQRLIKAKQGYRSIDEHTISSLTPGTTVELMKELLGAASRYAKIDYPVFIEKEIKTHSYLYNLKNALLKITSKDNKAIDSLTVFGYDDKIYHEMLDFFSDNIKPNSKLGKTKINKEHIEHCARHKAIHSCRDYSLVVSLDVPNPYYMTFTYFVYQEESSNYEETGNPESLIGSTIDGFCISKDSNSVYFIYDEESR